MASFSTERALSHLEEKINALEQQLNEALTRVDALESKVFPPTEETKDDSPSGRSSANGSSKHLEQLSLQPEDIDTEVCAKCRIEGKRVYRRTAAGNPYCTTCLKKGAGLEEIQLGMKKLGGGAFYHPRPSFGLSNI
jgi:predicted RNase H-like nuclease (RuvC/YqgF family)